MDKELFLKEVAKAATAYAEETVYQPELHRDAVDAISKISWKELQLPMTY